MFSCLAEEHRTTGSQVDATLQLIPPPSVPPFGPTEKRLRRRSQKASQHKASALSAMLTRGKNADFTGGSQVFLRLTIKLCNYIK